MDWIKYPYRVPCQFNDGGPRSVIQWTVARPDAPLLDIPSRIVNLVWELDKQSYDDPIGEVWDGFGRRAYWTRTPPGIDGQRRCGPDDYFIHGGRYPSSSVQLYGAFGWPICCYPPVEILGGAAAGGNVSPAVQRPIAVYGGAAAGGTIHPRITGRVDPMSGGLTVGVVQLDQVVRTDLMSGGLTVGVVQLDQVVRTDLMSGGLTVGVVQLDQVVRTDLMSGGLTVGVVQVNQVIGSITTVNLAGGPISLTEAITFIGAGAVVLSVTGNSITFTVSGVPPNPPSAFTVAPGNAVVNLAATVGAGGASINWYQNTVNNLSTATLLGNSSTGTWSDTTVTNNVPYFFWSTSVSPGGLESTAAGPLEAEPSPDLLYDSFTTNLGTLSNRPFEAGTALPQNWVVYDGTWNVASGAVTVTSSVGDSVAYGNAESATGSATAVVVIPAGSSNSFMFGPIGRVSDGADFWLFLIDNKGPSSPWGRAFIYERSGGSYTQRASLGGLTFTAGSTVTLKISCSGTTITGYINGSSAVSYSSSDLETATGWGFRAYVDGTSANLTPTLVSFTVTNP